MWYRISDTHYQTVIDFATINVKYDLHVGSRDAPNWTCSDYTEHTYLEGTNRSGYNTLGGAQRAAVRAVRSKGRSSMLVFDQPDHALLWKQIKAFVNSLSDEQLERPVIVQGFEIGYAFAGYVGPMKGDLRIGKSPDDCSLLAKAGVPTLILERGMVVVFDDEGAGARCGPEPLT